MKLKGVEILKVGTWSGNRTVTFTAAMLDEMVANFSELTKKVAGFGVPIKLGHNDNIGEPAYGWAEHVYRSGDVMLADVNDIEPALVDRIQKRQYNSVSIEMRPQVTYEGRKFTNVLSAISLLGAEHPAVKGLKPLSEAHSMFAADDEKVVFNQEINVKIFSQDEADALVLAATTRVQSALDALTAELALANTAKDVAVAALSAFKAENETRAFTDLIDGAIKAGKVLPKSKDAYVAMAATFAGKTEKVKLGDKEVSAVEMFKSFLDGLPPVVKFGETGTAKQGDDAVQGEKASDRIDAAAKIEQAKNPKLSYQDAVNVVLASTPDLKTDYLAEIA